MVLDEQSLGRCGGHDASGTRRPGGSVACEGGGHLGISKDSGVSLARATGQLWRCANCQGSQSRAGKLRLGSRRAR